MTKKVVHWPGQENLLNNMKQIWKPNLEHFLSKNCTTTDMAGWTMANLSSLQNDQKSSALARSAKPWIISNKKTHHQKKKKNNMILITYLGALSHPHYEVLYLLVLCVSVLGTGKWYLWETVYHQTKQQHLPTDGFHHPLKFVIGSPQH